jgi:uncharacterized protein (TIGR02284 family)
MNPISVRNALAYLYRTVEAGEKGHALVATNMNNRALKILYRSYAQQRLKFKEEILVELRRLGAYAKPRSEFLGLLHRGRINIFSALTIGDENVENLILKEILFGEAAAIRAYEKTLEKDLPPETREMVKRQFEEVHKTIEEARLMQGLNGKRLLLRLYETEKTADEAIQALKKAGVSEKAIEIKSWDPAIALYRGRGTTMLETIITGAAGGMILGFVVGILASIGIMRMPGFGLEQTAPAILLLAILGLTAGIAFVGGMIGLFLGWGISSGDKFVYADTVQHGEILIRALVDITHTSRAWNIMKQVAVVARAHRVSELPA